MDSPAANCSRARVVLAAALVGAAWLCAVHPYDAAAAAPQPPYALVPASSAAVQGTPVQLFATVGDPDADSLTVTFYGRPVTAAARPDFTLIELPDTQNYCAGLAGGSPGDFLAQTNWIVSSRVSRNIAYVAHVGDIVQSGDEAPQEWVIADFCMKQLENPATTLRPDGIPFGVSPGNHDIGRYNQAITYNQFFGVSRFEGRGYYGGHFGADNSNWFERFRASGLDFIVIGVKLAWEGDPAVVAWADSLLTAYADHRAIIVSHYLLNSGSPPTFSTQGQEIYDGLKHHTNLILMLCGHLDVARRADTWNGHTIHTIMANYQYRRGGDGWLRIMEFSPARNHIRVRTFSPTRGHFETDPDSISQFTIPCDLSGAPGDFEPIGTYARVPSGGTASIVWAGLRRGGAYEWYASVGDRTATVNGPIQSFNIVDTAAPVAEITSPNGEALVAGQPVDIRWIATDNYEVRDLDLFLSRSGTSGPWETLALGLENTGTFHWIASGPSTEHAVFSMVVRDDSYNWTVDATDTPVRIVITAGVEDGPAGALALDPVAPNPTRGPSRIGVTLPAAERIRLSVVDVAGREVAVLADGPAAAGRSEFAWDGRIARDRAPAGLYFVRLRTPDRVLTRRFAITR